MSVYFHWRLPTRSKSVSLNGHRDRYDCQLLILSCSIARSVVQNIKIPHSLEVAGGSSYWMKHNKTSGNGIHEKPISVSFQVPRRGSRLKDTSDHFSNEWRLCHLCQLWNDPKYSCIFLNIVYKMKNSSKRMYWLVCFYNKDLTRFNKQFSDLSSNIAWLYQYLASSVIIT